MKNELEPGVISHAFVWADSGAPIQAWHQISGPITLVTDGRPTWTVEDMRPLARQIARETGRAVSLVRLRVVDVLEQIAP